VNDQPVCTYKHLGDVVDVLALHVDAVDVENLVTLVQHAALVRRPALHDTTDDHRLTIITNCCSLGRGVK